MAAAVQASLRSAATSVAAQLLVLTADRPYRRLFDLTLRSQAALNAVSRMLVCHFLFATFTAELLNFSNPVWDALLNPETTSYHPPDLLGFAVATAVEALAVLVAASTQIWRLDGALLTIMCAVVLHRAGGNYTDEDAVLTAFPTVFVALLNGILLILARGYIRIFQGSVKLFGLSMRSFPSVRECSTSSIKDLMLNGHFDLCRLDTLFTSVLFFAAMEVDWVAFLLLRTITARHSTLLPTTAAFYALFFPGGSQWMLLHVFLRRSRTFWSLETILGALFLFARAAVATERAAAMGALSWERLAQSEAEEENRMDMARREAYTRRNGPARPLFYMGTYIPRLDTNAWQGLNISQLCLVKDYVYRKLVDIQTEIEHRVRGKQNPLADFQFDEFDRCPYCLETPEPPARLLKCIPCAHAYGCTTCIAAHPAARTDVCAMCRTVILELVVDKPTPSIASRLPPRSSSPRSQSVRARARAGTPRGEAAQDGDASFASLHGPAGSGTVEASSSQTIEVATAQHPPGIFALNGSVLFESTLSSQSVNRAAGSVGGFEWRPETPTGSVPAPWSANPTDGTASHWRPASHSDSIPFPEFLPHSGTVQSRASPARSPALGSRHASPGLNSDRTLPHHPLRHHSSNATASMASPRLANFRLSRERSVSPAATTYYSTSASTPRPAVPCPSPPPFHVPEWAERQDWERHRATSVAATAQEMSKLLMHVQRDPHLKSRLSEQALRELAKYGV